MKILLAILLLLVGVIFYLVYRNRKLKRQAILLSKEAELLTKKDLQFLEFTADMYIKYAKELKIHDPGQHEQIVKELEAIRKKIEPKINS
jgi:hypothetical protein